MMRKSLAVFFLMMLTLPASAGLLPLHGDQIVKLLSDKTLYAKVDGKAASQLFQKSGATFYSVGDAQNQGAWKIDGDKYCSVWPPNETWVCYDVLQDDKTVTFVSPSGKQSVFSTMQ
ncbi:hypothetical protein [Aestuariivirga litoralis]|uniref:hypothetical protein n=1 Tax=Aestuariivirga litoralis TaxID=2650924 RepID=UPI0018C48BE1|nr:hypothetical protein [Aestuariivirga litoralis]MBG1231637.1 hypothetical protein [Aestuariivirga litoralis]